MDKKTLRKQLLQTRNELNQTYRQMADEQIYRNIISCKNYQNATTVFCFVSTKDEINTHPVLEHAFHSGKRVVVPKCIGKGIMHAFEIHTFEDLECGKFGILEPCSYCHLVSPEEIDFAILPCLSCNWEGYRLGYGGGYYDRYLVNAPFKSAVICYKELICETIPIEKYDLKADMVISDFILEEQEISEEFLIT